MTRLFVATLGQLLGVLIVAVGVAIVWTPAGLVVLGGGLIWWWRYVFDVGGDE